MDAKINTCLLHLLAKSGRLQEMLNLWSSIRNDPKQKHIIDTESWTTVIQGLGQHGKGKEAIETFTEMISCGMNPNEITFIAVLNACSHSGLISEARLLLKQMSDFNVPQNVKHRCCFVDALGRAGLFDEALAICQTEKPHNAVMWMSLLGSSRGLQNVKIAEIAVQAIKQIDPNSKDLNVARVLLQQMYEKEGRHEDGMELSRIRKPKIPGISQIEVNEEIASFVAHDPIVETNVDLKKELIRIEQEILSFGHSPDLSLVTHPLDAIKSDEDKRWSLCTHSERIAIAFGLLHIPSGEPLYLTKNLRICSDCHQATKLISKIRNREIIMGDANRFHHFKDGKCSCNDYY